MRVLIVTNHFWPENFRVNDLAVGLKERGHDVCVFTAIPDYPEGKFYPGYGLFKRRTEYYQGILIKRYPLIPRGKGRSWNLILNYLSSAMMSCLLAPLYCRGRYDVIFVFHTSPISVGFPAVLLRRLKSIPLIFWNLDLWPESLSATGAVTSATTINLVRKVVRSIYRRCDRLLVSSRGFVESIKHTGGYPNEILYFPNWVEPEYLKDAGLSTPCLPALPQGFRIIFAGNIGVAQDFSTILAAAEMLKDHVDIHWIIIGEGRQSAWVREQVTKRGLERQFHLLGRYPAEVMSHFFVQADALLMTLRREPIFALTVPGKLQSYMASGKPIIAGMDGEGAKIVNEAVAGLTCPAENPAELAAQVFKLYQMTPEERLNFGDNGRDYCEKNFNRSMLLDSLEEIMMELTS